MNKKYRLKYLFGPHFRSVCWNDLYFDRMFKMVSFFPNV